LGPVIELTDSENDEDAELPMRLAPKPAQGNANAVTSDPHLQSEDAGSEVAVVDYDSEFAAKQFPFDETFISASQKTPRQQSELVADRRGFVLPLPNIPAKAIDNASQSFHRARAVYTPRLLTELDEHS
jgi:hypothetical protein